MKLIHVKKTFLALGLIYVCSNALATSTCMPNQWCLIDFQNDVQVLFSGFQYGGYTCNFIGGGQKSTITVNPTSFSPSVLNFTFQNGNQTLPAIATFQDVAPYGWFTADFKMNHKNDIGYIKVDCFQSSKNKK